MCRLSSLKVFVTNLISTGFDPVRPLSLLEPLIKFYWFYTQDAARNTTDFFGVENVEENEQE
jgi:hypothetical protein